MLAAIQFDFPWAFVAIFVIAAALVWSALQLRKRSFNKRQIAILLVLRAMPFLTILFLAARPNWFTKEPPDSKSRSVVLLMDRSESMALEENNSTRYQKAVDFLRGRLLPALKSTGLPVRAMLFDRAVEPAEGDRLASTTPKGDRTNLGGAIAEAMNESGQRPLAVIALTDGIANENADNTRALTSLVEAGVPFIGVGFGSDQGVCTLSLRSVEAPSTVSPKTAFSISSQLEVMNADDLPAFDLVLFRDGQVAQKRSVQAGKGSRTWLENFQVSEEKEGAHTYSVQLFPPASSSLKCVNVLGNASVKITNDKELRILYVQGALTWDYKFISLALRSDQTIKLTGLTRTSKQSVFRQNVENAGELVNGFPNSLDELAPFRVVVLSNLRPADLTTAQQDILARFCSEVGGGVIMIGGSGTFDGSWQGTRLEQLLPVIVSPNFGVQGLDRPFRMQLTDEALQHPVFQIVDNKTSAEAWGQLPTFTQYGRVDGAKPGAHVWAVHQTDDGPHGRRILMASQRYGAGLSAVLCIQNFWRWRLARDSEPQQFDRFWRQFFRFLGDVGRQDVSIHVAEQELRPDMDVRITLEKQPNPKIAAETSRKFFVRVEDKDKNVLRDESVELEPLHAVDLSFHAAKAGVYTVSVSDSMKVPASSRQIEIRDLNLEFQDTARNMETLRQWAAVSDGLALKAEECPDATDLVRSITGKIEESKKNKQQRHPIGLNAWVLTFVLGTLGTEWLLRKKWGLI
jgi:uncharacterized membrane protein